MVSSNYAGLLRSHSLTNEYVGDVFKISTRGQPILVLSSPQAAFELLEGRGELATNIFHPSSSNYDRYNTGTMYSDRPPAVMAGELLVTFITIVDVRISSHESGIRVGWNRGLGYSPYGERFKEFRRMFHQTMGPRQTLELMPLQKWGAAKFMLRLLEYPEGFIEHARQYVRYFKLSLGLLIGL